ncbi:uncharacterized protein LOC125685646 [Lagopus muta]|uniref:uncharacterized protein LOC125685646 n=1 Tax=Lagopus muta TaxID=64668 RepID=UPI00209CD715|nr:uncharacterized protein LOC125685646 [Lagopus muta]
METFSALDLTKQTDGEKYWQQEAERAPKQDRSVQRAVTPQALAPQLQREQSGTAELGSGMQQHPTAGTGREKRGLASPHAARGFNRSLDSICVSHPVNWASKGGRRKQQVPLCRSKENPKFKEPPNRRLPHAEAEQLRTFQPLFIKKPKQLKNNKTTRGQLAQSLGSKRAEFEGVDLGQLELNGVEESGCQGREASHSIKSHQPSWPPTNV